MPYGCISLLLVANDPDSIQTKQRTDRITVLLGVPTMVYQVVYGPGVLQGSNHSLLVATSQPISFQMVLIWHCGRASIQSNAEQQCGLCQMRALDGGAVCREQG